MTTTCTPYISRWMTEGRRGRFADEVAGAVPEDEAWGRVARESLATTGAAVGAEEVTTSARVDDSRVARSAALEVGATRVGCGLDRRSAAPPRTSFAALRRHVARSPVLLLAVLAAGSFLAFVPSDAFAQLSPPTYYGLVNAAAYPADNPDCSSPPLTCYVSASLTAPGTITLEAPGTPLERGQLTFGNAGPLISVFAESLDLGSEWDRGRSQAQGAIRYYVEIVGPEATVPVHIAVAGAVGASNGFYPGPIAGTAASVSLSVNGAYVACAASPFPETACSQQQSFYGTYSQSFPANTPITVDLNAFASAYSMGYTGTYSAYLDPVFSVDPAFPNASSYTVVVSPGITQGSALVFANGFEAGDATGWSAASP
jgi:hypothetical protein